LDRARYADFIDIRKEVVKKNFLTRLVYVEFSAFGLGVWMMSRTIKKFPVINGSAFAIKRKVFEKIGGFTSVVSEDLDIATKVFVEGYTSEYANDIKVMSYVPDTWREWFMQRKRWSVGAMVWIKRWYKDLIKSVVRHPQISFPAIFFTFPSIFFIFANLFIPAMFFPGLLNLYRTITVLFVTFIMFSIVFYVFVRRIGFKFKINDFFFFYFFYSILTLALMVYAFIKVLLLKI